MVENEKAFKDKAKKICRLQFSFGIFFLVLLTGFISILLASYFNKMSDLINKPVYILIMVLFIISILCVIGNSIWGIKFTKEINNKTLKLLFLFSAIFIIPFISIYSIFASATLLLNYFEKTKKIKKL